MSAYHKHIYTHMYLYGDIHAHVCAHYIKFFILEYVCNNNITMIITTPVKKGLLIHYMTTLLLQQHKDRLQQGRLTVPSSMDLP